MLCISRQIYNQNIAAENGLAAFSTGVFTVMILTILSRQLRMMYLEYILGSMETNWIIWRALNALRNKCPIAGSIIFNFNKLICKFLVLRLLWIFLDGKSCKFFFIMISSSDWWQKYKHRGHTQVIPDFGDIFVHKLVFCFAFWILKHRFPDMPVWI